MRFSKLQPQLMQTKRSKLGVDLINNFKQSTCIFNFYLYNWKRLIRIHHDRAYFWPAAHAALNRNLLIYSVIAFRPHPEDEINRTLNSKMLCLLFFLWLVYTCSGATLLKYILYLLDDASRI